MAICSAVRNAPLIVNVIDLFDQIFTLPERKKGKRLLNGFAG